MAPNHAPNRRTLWRTAVLRHRAAGMTGEVRALMLRLLEDMAANGVVSVPRSRLAEDFGVNPRRITERIQRARELGLLDVIRAGRPGVTAVYSATIPDHKKLPDGSFDLVRSTAPSLGAPGGTKQKALHGAPGGPPTGRRDEPSPDTVTVPGTTPSLYESLSSSNPNGGRERSERRTRATSNPRIRPISKAEAERDRQLAGLRQLIAQGDAPT